LRAGEQPLESGTGAAGTARGASSTSPTQRPMARNTCTTARQSLGNSQTMATMNTASRTRKITGWFSAAHKPANTATSSAIDAAQFETGSGEVLIMIRPPAFVAWTPAVSVPPTSAAASWAAMLTSPTAPAASTAPAGIRTKV
jgi:hypothetical protein